MNKFENRAITGDIAVEGRKISGTWAVFNSPSEILMMQRANGEYVKFREILMPTAFDRTDLSNVKCVLDHDERAGYLGRTPNSVTIAKSDRGMIYECDVPNLPVGDRALEFVNRGDYKGNSFRFYTKSGDDRWERNADGTYTRYIDNVSAVAHIGPVFDPAYTDTDVQVAMRSLDDFIEEEVKVESKLHEQRNRELSIKKREIECLN